jgi:hypothetical protein
VKGSYLRPVARHWSIGGTLLLFAMAGQALANGTVSGTLKVASGSKGTLDGAVVAATSVANRIARATTDDTGKYSLDLAAGTYTVAVVGRGLETQEVDNFVVKDGDKIAKDFTLADAKPFCILKAAAPIPLTDDINSDSFKDAPDINVNSGLNVCENDKGDVTEWTGPATIGGRFRVKYSADGIHLAADLTFAKPNVDFGEPSTQYEGNAIEFDLQNDPQDPTRTSYDTDHNWQLIVGLGPTPDWWFYGGLSAPPMLNGAAAKIKDYLLVKDRPNFDGNLVRLNLPWSFFLKGDQATPMTAPKDGDLGAMDLVLDNSAPDATKDTADANRQFQIAWSGICEGYHDPSVLRPIQFCPKAQ